MGLYKKDGSLLRTNITFCTGTGGHNWWNVSDPESDIGYWVGPNNHAFDVTYQEMKFFCENGAQCTGEVPKPVIRLPPNDDPVVPDKDDSKSYTWVWYIVGAVVVLVVIGGTVFLLQSSKPETHVQMDT